MAGWNHSGVFKEKACTVCGINFKPKSGVHKFCSEKCKGKWQYITGTSSTENQYKEISGNWKRYCSRLMYYGGRKRDKLTVEILLKKLEEQDYKCAISGLPLECSLEVGVKNPYNVSVDRVQAGGPYTEDNIQLVCVAFNKWRADTPLEDFIEFCRAVVKHQDQKNGRT
jgi:hypothetical protein